jgi:PTS system mannose-specific IIC component
LLGGLLGLDTVSCVQAMVSRPIVAAPIAGYLLGDPMAGLSAGAVLELVSLNQLPIGASRGWDTAPASVAAAAVAALSPGGAVALVVAVGLGVLVGWLGSWTVHLMRIASARLVALDDSSVSTGPSVLTARHLSAITVDFVRAFALTLAALLVAAPLASSLGGSSVTTGQAATLLILVCAGLALGSDLRMMAKGRSVVLAVAAGLLLGAVASLWLV